MLWRIEQHCKYDHHMDERSLLGGQSFVWDSDKATSNVLQHGVRFELAREASSILSPGMKMQARHRKHATPALA